MKQFVYTTEFTFMPFSMIKAVMPCGPASCFVRAYTTKVFAMVPLVHHILLPFRT